MKSYQSGVKARTIPETEEKATINKGKSSEWDRSSPILI